MRKFAAALVVAARSARRAPPAPAAIRDLNTVKEGDAIPAFKGRLVTGEDIDVGALIGKKVIVIAFWSIYCKPCVEEISSLIRLQEQLGGDKLEVIGINADTELGLARIRTFMAASRSSRSARSTTRSSSTRRARSRKLLGVGFLPTVLSVNLKGQVEKIFIGFEEKSEPEIFAGIRQPAPDRGRGRPTRRRTRRSSPSRPSSRCAASTTTRGGRAASSRTTTSPKELERIAEIARRKALKMALREALVAVGVSLLRRRAGGRLLHAAGRLPARRPLQGPGLPDQPPGGAARRQARQGARVAGGLPRRPTTT